MTKEVQVNYQHTGRYFTFGNPDKACTLLIALHGYSQLPEYFIRKFHFLDPDKYYVICPEGPHRFYREGTSGRVGASWMTKEDRLNDIKNYIRLLDAVAESIDTDHHFNRRILLGFSQGGATASRWIGYGNTPFNEFILWAAVFPPDMDDTVKQNFYATQNHMVIGDSDEFSTVEKAKEYHQKLSKEGMKFAFHTFKGNHDLNKELLYKLVI